MFARGVVREIVASGFIKGRSAIFVAGLGFAAATQFGGPVPWIANLAALWALFAVLSPMMVGLRHPQNWSPPPICRGTHPGRCALTIDVQVGEEQAALALATYLHGRGLAATFFVHPAVAETAASLRDRSHEIGGLSGVLSTESLVRATHPWHNRDLARLAPTIGWSIHLRPDANPSRVRQVVGTDIVRISASTPIATLGRWLDDWDARAVVASTFSATFEAAR